MAHDPAKGRAALRRGRVSIAGAEYFLTICTDQRRADLTASHIASSLLSEATAMDFDATWQLRCAIVMPDHVHLLVVLGERLPLGKAAARLKAKTSTLLRSTDPSLEWERNFFDRRIRPDEDRVSVFLYIYLNPYRAGLCAREDRWPWFYCRPDDWAWFGEMLDAERPIPEWLA